MLKRKDKGPKVIDLQQKILALNPLGLPRFGVDGDLGDETLHALAILLDDESIEESDVVTDAQLARLEQMVNASRPLLLKPRYIDRRGEASAVERRGNRSPLDLDIVWHQTDCEMGEKPSRYDGVPVHFVVTSGGQILQLHDVTTILYAAHALNKRGISIEVEGHFAGIDGDLTDASYPDYHKDAGRTPQSLTDLQRQAAKLCARIIKEQVAALGGKIKRQVTHRQGVKGVRRRDPGEEICRDIIRPLEAEIAPFDWAFTAGHGEQAPDPWSGQNNGIKY